MVLALSVLSTVCLIAFVLVYIALAVWFVLFCYYMGKLRGQIEGLSQSMATYQSINALYQEERKRV